MDVNFSLIDGKIIKYYYVRIAIFVVSSPEFKAFT